MKSPSTTLPPKKDVARALLLRGSLFVHLDPRVDGVVAPTWLRKQPQLVLQVGLDMPVPIPDLRVDESGVFGTLSFNRAPFTCTVPWEAVFALVGEDGRGMVWPESMPSEIAAEVDREAGRRGVEPPRPATATPVASDAEDVPLAPVPAASERPHLVSVQGGAGGTAKKDDGTDEKDDDARGDAPERKGRRELPPYLRVVK